MRIGVYGEPNSATGSLAAPGILNSLGRVDAELIETLVRESIQNSWDAKRDDAKQVLVRVARSTLTGDGLRRFRELAASPTPAGAFLGEVEHEVRPRLLAFSDYGTHGLSGPLTADRAAQRQDFVDFVFNIGQEPQSSSSGGSFGYGKSIFYQASRVHTVIIDSLCLHEGALQRRFIICRLRSPYVSASTPYTGRQWWGLTDESPGSVRPLLGLEADEMADALGLPPRHDRADLGTTVAVVDPTGTLGPSDEGESDVTMPFLAKSVMWNFWPRMIGTPTLRVTVEDEGEVIPIPNPRRDARLKLFASAMGRMRLPHEEVTSGPARDSILTRLSPRTELGRLVLSVRSEAHLPPPTPPLTNGEREMENGVHHVALIRDPEMIIQYLPGPPSDALTYAGVFKARLELDEVFRDSEPPAHDAWTARSIEDKNKRSIVSMALQRIRAACKNLVQPYQPAPVATTQVPLASLADDLADLIPGMGGSGARKESPRAPGPGGRSGKKSLVGYAGQARLLVEDGRPRVEYPFTLRQGSGPVALSAVGQVILAGGKPEIDPPVGGAAARVIRWVSPSGTPIHEDCPTTGEVGKWTVVVEGPRDAMLRVDVDAKALSR